MSITINSQLFGKMEARMDDLREAVGEEDMAAIQKAVERITKAFVEIRGTSSTGSAGGAAVSSDEPVKAKKGRKTKDGEPKVKREVKPGSWADQLQTVYSPVFNMAWGTDKKPAGILMKVAGYLKKQGKTKPTVEDMRDAITFIGENPDYKSETQLSRSAAGSTDEKPKARGRAKKTEKAESAPTPAETVAKLSAALSDDEDSDEEEEEEKDEMALISFEYKGNNYLKDQFNEVYTTEGVMEWVGTFNGKKITKGDMPARVKKYLDSQD